MIQTENIELDKYESSDSTNYLVTFNGNMDKIDTAIGDISDNVDTATSTANTALSTANTASTTATTAYTTATSKASIDDLASSTSTTYSSDKIDSLISGITPGTVIDDTTASATTTYSSSKISDIVGAVIDDTSTSLTSTWSSSKINTEVFNNRKIIEYLHSGKIYSVSPITSITTETSLENYKDNELSYTVTEDSIVLGSFKVFAVTSVDAVDVGGDYSPSFIKNDYSNRQNYSDLTSYSSISSTYRSGEHIINTIPTIIKAGSTIKLYANNMSYYRGSQIFGNVKIRLKTISSILNS